MLHSDTSKPHKLTGPFQGQKSLFRVTVRPSTGTGASATADSSQERIYHARRPHRKSRAGCVTCKQRRIKCDEAKPHCVRCQKHGVACSYDAPPPASKGWLAQVPLVGPDPTAYSMSLFAVSSHIDDLLNIKGRDGQFSDGLRALHHWHESTYPTVSEGPEQRVMRCKIIQLAFETPFLMHTIVATAATHLRHVHIASNNDPSYKLLEATHWQKSINQYSRELSTGLTPKNMDGLFSACLLMTVNSFHLDQYDPRSSFIFSSDPTALNWLQLQSGLRHLLMLAGPWICKSMWWGMFQQSRNENPLFEDDRPGREGLEPRFADVCGIDETTTIDSNPYLWPLRMLTPLLGMERSAASMAQYTNFMGRLLPPYMEKLRQRDPPALLILGTWLSLMAGMELWWADTRARSECAAICMFLRDSEDPLVVELLEMPAKTCGFVRGRVEEFPS